MSCRIWAAHIFSVCLARQFYYFITIRLILPLSIFYNPLRIPNRQFRTPLFQQNLKYVFHILLIFSNPQFPKLIIEK